MKISGFSKFRAQILPKNVKKKLSQARMQAKKNTFFCLVSLSCFFHYVCIHEGITMGINSGEQDKQLTETKVIATAKEKHSQTQNTCLLFIKAYPILLIIVWSY